MIVPIEEIVSVSSGVESAEVAFQSGGLSICYVIHMKKRILRRETVVFQPEEGKGDPEVGEKWCKMIQGALDKGRLLIHSRISQKEVHAIKQHLKLVYSL